MAKVYAPPVEVGDPPDFDQFKDVNGKYDFNKHNEAESKWVEQLQDWVRQNSRSKSSLIGELVHFPVGDGYATYVIWNTKPASLIHCPIGDAWQIPDAQARGLRTTDLRQMVEGSRKLDALFGRHP